MLKHCRLLPHTYSLGSYGQPPAQHKHCKKWGYSGIGIKILTRAPLPTPQAGSCCHAHTSKGSGWASASPRGHKSKIRAAVTKPFARSWARVKINVRFVGAATCREAQCFVVSGSNNLVWPSCCGPNPTRCAVRGFAASLRKYRGRKGRRRAVTGENSSPSHPLRIMKPLFSKGARLSPGFSTRSTKS